MRPQIRRWTTLGALLIGALALLAGCASLPPTAIDPHPKKAVATLPEPADDEVVVVDNGNAFAGRHSGIFVGPHLSDPSGSYMVKRPQGPGGGPATLQDYVRYQLLDGPRVRLYRFRLTPEEFEVVAARQRNGGLALPLFCASDVQNLIAGVGPFRGLPRVRWTTPSSLKEALDPLTRGSGAPGRCTWANGRPCVPPADGEPQPALTLHGKEQGTATR